jgi:hypothetical protein
MHEKLNSFLLQKVKYTLGSQFFIVQAPRATNLYLHKKWLRQVELETA